MHCHKLLLVSLLLTACTLICAEDSAVGGVADSSNPKVVPLAAADDEAEKKKTTTTTTTTTTAAPETTTTSSSTAAPTTTTTAAPKTTSSTTTTTTTTTTPAPTTTSTTVAPITTTTPKPGPYPAPKIGVWNSTCIKVQMAAQLNFTYVTKDNKNATALYNIPDTAVVDHSICDPNAMSQTMQVNWGPADFQHTMVLEFSRDNHTVNMTMLLFTLPLTAADFPNAKENQTIQLLHKRPEFSMPIKMSYHCTRQQVLPLNETMNSPIIGHVALQDLQLEAYRTANGTNAFSEARDCDSSHTSDIVPIAVGVALVALIVIVLVAYLCARRRSTLRGYMSF